MELNLVHVDVWEPTSKVSENGSNFFLLFVDDFSCFQWFYVITQKIQAMHIFQHFVTYAQMHYDLSIK